MLNFDCGIYAIIAPSGKRYIGSARSFRLRWQQHRALLRGGRHHCAGLQRAFIRYGEDRLAFVKLAFVPVTELIQREQEQIDAYPRRQLYNTNPVAGSRLGVKHSAETRERMSIAHRGKPRSAEHRANISKALTGKVRSAELRAKDADVKRGKRASDATKARMREGQLRVVRSNNTSGYRGVYFDRRRGKWIATPKLDGARQTYLGQFDSPEAANDAIIAARSTKKA